MHRKLWKTFNFVIVGILIFSLAGCAVPATAPSAPAAAEPAPAAAAGLDACKGQSLVLGSMTDQYVAAFRVLAPQFAELSGANITLDELGYVDLYQKLIADFVGQTGNYDLMTVDIVWSGEFGQNEYTLPLDEFMARDEAELQLDDILPVAWTLGEWQGAHVAYPLAGYANVLNYRKDLLEAAGIEPPKTQEELLAAAQQLTDADAGVYGMALLGAKGSAVAQDYMAWVQQHGGSHPG
jgi:multiple sugar transport system substrate-binding protein